MKNACSKKKPEPTVINKIKVHITCCPKVVKTQRPGCLEDEEATTTTNN